MKKYLIAISIIAICTACNSNNDSSPFEVVSGEIEETFTIDWRNLPANETIPITGPEQVRSTIFVSIADFGLQSATQFINPGINAMYYDISGWDSSNSVGIFDVSINVLTDNGIPRRLTNFSIQNLENTVTNNNGQLELSREVIFDNNEGVVTADGLFLASQSLEIGRLILEVEIAGRNVVLQSPNSFDITFTIGLTGLARIDQ